METPEPLGIEVRCIERDTWKVRLYDTSSPSAEMHTCHADLRRDDKFICRMVVGRSFRDRDELLAAMESRAHAWIDDWERRDHTGNTGFVEL